MVQVEIREVLAFAAAMARRTGLGLSEMAALEHLQQAGGEGMTPTQLGRRLSLSSGAVTALVDRMERAGQVERRPNPSDRRSSVVRTLPSGLAGAREHLLPVAADLLEESVELTDEERAVVGAYLQAVTQVFARHARGEASTQVPEGFAKGRTRSQEPPAVSHQQDQKADKLRARAKGPKRAESGGEAGAC